MNTSTHPLRSKIIIGATPSPETAALLRTLSSSADDVQINLCVFEVEVDGAVRYCCWAGGTVTAPVVKKGRPTPRIIAIDRNSALLPSLTPVGQAAVEALVNLPCLQNERGLHATLVFQEIAIGKTPLRDKVLASFRMSADARAIIAFVGDLHGALDGHMSPAFNLVGAIDVSACKGMALPCAIKKGQKNG